MAWMDGWIQKIGIFNIEFCPGFLRVSTHTGEVLMLHTILSNGSSTNANQTDYDNTGMNGILWGNEYPPETGLAILAHTIRNVGTLSDNIDYEDQEEIDGLRIHSKYFRYFSRFRVPCDIFLLLTTGLEETTGAIHRTGFGSSDEVMFLIQVEEIHQGNQLISQFSNHLFNMVDPEQSFHASILFIDGARNIGAFCYFCDSPTDKLQIYPGSVNNANNSYSNVKQFADKLNNNGYGQPATLTIAGDIGIPASDFSPELCTVPKLLLNSLETHMGNELITFSCLQRYLNVTLTKGRELSVMDKPKMNWLLNIGHWEGANLQATNIYAKTRGSVSIVGEHVYQAISCKDSKSMEMLDYTLRSILNFPLLAGMLSISVGYGFISQNIYMGLDLLLPVIGQSLAWGQEHPKRFIGVALLWVLFLSCAYQSYISTNGIRILGYPSVLELVLKQSYNVFLLIGGLESIPKQFYDSLSDQIRKEVDVILGSRKLSDLVDFTVEYTDFNITRYVEPIAVHKLLLLQGVTSSVLHRTGNGIKRFENSHICTMSNLVEDLGYEWFMPRDIRIWSYLSKRTSHLNRKWTEMGMYQFGYQWSVAQQMKNCYGGFQLDKGKVVDGNESIGLKSPLGLVCAYSFGALVTAMIFHIGQLVVDRINRRINNRPVSPVKNARWSRDENRLKVLLRMRLGKWRLWLDEDD